LQERESRRQEVLDAALAELLAGGAAALTMQGVARRAGASKETLYSWFGGRDELLGALVEANADNSATRVTQALDAGVTTPTQARETLVAYGQALLGLLTGRASVELNRAAMSSPALAERLLTSGRHRIGPRVQEYLARLHTEQILDAPDSAQAYRTLYGLIVRDTQIRVLLGDPPPNNAEIAQHATGAVDAFFTLFHGAP
jgi:AcrR family transcriptional regulator